MSIHRALLAASGAVLAGDALTLDEAVQQRRRGRDVVVCGADLAANRQVAETIESSVGKAVRHPPHQAAGQDSLPHFQPRDRPPSGHTFYETPKRKAR